MSVTEEVADIIKGAAKQWRKVQNEHLPPRQVFRQGVQDFTTRIDEQRAQVLSYAPIADREAALEKLLVSFKDLMRVELSLDRSLERDRLYHQQVELQSLLHRVLERLPSSSRGREDSSDTDISTAVTVTTDSTARSSNATGRGVNGLEHGKSPTHEERNTNTEKNISQGIVDEPSGGGGGYGSGSLDETLRLPGDNGELHSYAVAESQQLHQDISSGQGVWQSTTNHEAESLQGQKRKSSFDSESPSKRCSQEQREFPSEQVLDEQVLTPIAPQEPKSIPFKDLFQCGKGRHKHFIIKSPPLGGWYILQCDEHNVHFGLHPIVGARNHLREIHGRVLETKEDVIGALGTRVRDCFPRLAATNNEVMRDAVRNGYTPLNYEKWSAGASKRHSISELVKLRPNLLHPAVSSVPRSVPIHTGSGKATCEDSIVVRHISDDDGDPAQAPNTIYGDTTPGQQTKAEGMQNARQDRNTSRVGADRTGCFKEPHGAPEGVPGLPLSTAATPRSKSPSVYGEETATPTSWIFGDLDEVLHGDGIFPTVPESQRPSPDGPCLPPLPTEYKHDIFTMSPSYAGNPNFGSKNRHGSMSHLVTETGAAQEASSYLPSIATCTVTHTPPQSFPTTPLDKLPPMLPQSPDSLSNFVNINNGSGSSCGTPIINANERRAPEAQMTPTAESQLRAIAQTLYPPQDAGGLVDDIDSRGPRGLQSSPPQRSDSWFRCRYCEALFSRSKSLTRHIQESHYYIHRQQDLRGVGKTLETAEQSPI